MQPDDGVDMDNEGDGEEFDEDLEIDGVRLLPSSPHPLARA